MKRSTPGQNWSIIIFCYNEEASIRRVVSKVRKVLSRISSPRNEILIVDDGSTDSSPVLIRGLVKEFPRVRALFHQQNLGIGRTLRDGYFNVRYENVCAVPADGQFDPSELVPFAQVPEGSFVSFFRKRQEGYSLYRRFLSAFNRLINEVFLGFNLEDVNWVKIYKRKALRGLDLRLESSLIESEICAKLIIQGSRFTQSPSIYHPREGGRAQGAGLRTVLRALSELIKLARVVEDFRRKA